ncbi:DUF5344 family protein [Metabacillus sp. FJAT-52054]|uniref:DUF5344 family protein n=1 Tax=Metabacillus sediminis TaxID=3117746 RepID=A0ABZ2NGY6_9BACI
MEIKLIESEVKEALRKLSTTVQNLQTDKQELSFSHSRLQLKTEIEQTEQAYYELMQSYQEMLLKISRDASQKITDYAEKERQLAKTMEYSS